MRVLIHAGFHKTGTTSVQQTLRRNRAALETHLRLLLPEDLDALRSATRAWSATRDPVDAGLVRYEAAELAQSWDTGDTRPVLIASEDLCGHMPGRKDLDDYAAAPHLLALITQAITEARPQAAPQIHLTTRAPDDWLRSCHMQHLRAIRITEDADSYVARMAPSADFAPVIMRIAEAVAPCPVTHSAIEDHGDDPLAPFLARLDVPAGLHDPMDTPANTAPPAAWAKAVLALNRSDLGPEAWKTARAAIHEKDFA